jgi:lipooligosaccharide transport system permease protein
VATLFSSVFPGTFDTFVPRTYQHVYDAVLAAPVDVHEPVSAAGTWIAIKSGIYGSVPVLVAMAFAQPHPVADLLHVLALVIFAGLMGAAAVQRMRRTLID